MQSKKSNNLNYTKTDDLPKNDDAIEEVDLSPFVGSWTNTKEDSGQLPKVELRCENNQLYMKAFGAGKNELVEWAEEKCEVYTDNIQKGTAIAFITKFQFDKIDVDITANVKLGVLVVQTYTKFRDGSNRLNYYAREFYGPSQS